MKAVLLTALLLVLTPSPAYAPAQAAEFNPMDTAAEYQAYARDILMEHGWDYDQFLCVKSLWYEESRWSATADNPDSTAFGIPQLLKMTTTDPAEQIELGIKYIEHRYDKPCTAWSKWKSRGWY